MKIRTAVTSDSRELVQLADELIHLDDGLKREAMLCDSLKDPKSEILVVEVDDQIVGFVEVWVIPDFVEGTPIALVQNLIVDEKHRGRGIGGKLLETVVNHAEGQNASEIHVSTEFENEQAIDFYGKLGFKKRAILLERETSR